MLGLHSCSVPNTLTCIHTHTQTHTPQHISHSPNRLKGPKLGRHWRNNLASSGCAPGAGTGFLRRQGPWEKKPGSAQPVAQKLTESGPRGLGSARGGARGPEAGADCRGSLTLGWPGPSSGYQGQGKPSRHWLGRGRRARLPGEERSTPPFLSSPVSAIRQVSSTGNGGTKAFCKARPGRGCRSSGIGCQEAR